MLLFLNLAGGLLALATAIPLLPLRAGIVRSFDFPRIQIAVALAGTGLALAFAARDPASLAVLAAVVVGFVAQLSQILPFTRLRRVQAVATGPADAAAPRLALLVANVLESNRDTAPILAEIARLDPDVVLLLETDTYWQEAMAPLRARYPQAVEVPQANTYGLLFYARVPVRNVEVRALLQPDVPSIRAEIGLPGDVWVDFHGVHPRPPHPGHSSAPRDAELVLVARQVRERGGPAIVAGDLNDVAWSRTTTLFQNLSGLLDPRVGRGIYPTFPVAWPFLRWPLDHVFFSEHFLLERLECLGNVGSDHFPIHVVLAQAARAPTLQDAPQADAADHEAGREAIADAHQPA